MIDVLANARFRRLLAAQVVALIGTGLLTVALGLLAYDLAGNAAGAVLGTALAIKMLAYVVVAPLISAATYRMPRRVLLVGSDAVRATIAVLLPFVDQQWQIYALVFVLQAASATFTPTFQSVIPDVLVAERDYTRGLALSRLAYDLETLLSPVLAAALLTVLAYNYLFLGTVLGFIASAALVMRTALPRSASSRSPDSFWQRTTAGARIMLRRPVLRALLVLNLVVASATGLVVVNTVVYAQDVLSGSNTVVALLLAFYGAGSMSVALRLHRLLNRSSDRRLMLAGAVLTSLTLMATATLLLAGPGPVVGWVGFSLAWLALGAGTALINTPAARLLRYQSEPAGRSAVFAAQFSLSHACFFLTYPLAGWLGVLAGQPGAAAVLAGLAMAATVVAARIWPVTSASDATVERPPRRPAGLPR
ncbi:MAG: MFS transporter [Mycobacterium sp.]